MLCKILFNHLYLWYMFAKILNMDVKEMITSVWADRQLLNQPEYIDAIKQVIEKLDKGELRTAVHVNDTWQVNEWVKQAILLYFGIQKMETYVLPPFEFYDKMKLKSGYASIGVRAVPHAIARYGAYLAKNVVLMPSYVNIGAYVDEGTMVDTWATVGSCAQIGKHVHLSGGVGIGGVLEPLQANPTIIEDNCFIGARSEVVEGVIVGEGSVLAMGTFISASTKIVDRATGKVHIGHVPPYSVVVSGSLPGKPFPNNEPGPSLYCAVIVKTVDAQTRAKTAINELLRD